MYFVRICIAVEGEGGGMDPPHHVGHQQQKPPGLSRAQPLIRIRGVVLRGELQEKIRGRPVIILTIVRRVTVVRRSHNCEVALQLLGSLIVVR